MNTPPYLIVEEFSRVVDATKVALGLPHLNYLYGYLHEVREQLANDTLAGGSFATGKYPLVWLVEPFTVTGGSYGNAGSVGLQFFIIMGSSATITRAQRTEQVYKPSIIPIYHELLKQVQNMSNVFEIINIAAHDYTDRPYWGEKQQNAIDDIFDCREVNNLKINIANKQNCLTN
jgi:hypothetical protein